MTTKITSAGFIVVGVDDTRGSRAALDFALREGLAHGCSVEVVTTYQWTSPYGEATHPGTVVTAKEAAAAAQDAALREALDRLTDQPLVARIVIHEFAGKALVGRAQHATMLVVGSGRKGTVARNLMGSVSEYCVRHSPAPVVIVPDPGRVELLASPRVEVPVSSGSNRSAAGSVSRGIGPHLAKRGTPPASPGDTLGMES